MFKLPSKSKIRRKTKLSNWSFLALAHQLLPKLESLFQQLICRRKKRNSQKIQFRKIPMKKIHLFITAAIIWGIPGITLTIKGISAYLAQPKSDLWWLLLITLFVLASFFFIFRKIVNRYSNRIMNLTEPNNLLQGSAPASCSSRDTHLRGASP